MIHLYVSAGILVLLYVTTTLLLLASTNMAPKGQFIIGTAINAGGGRMSLDICLAGEEVAFQRSPSPEAAAMKVPDARQVHADILSGTLLASESKKLRTVRQLQTQINYLQRHHGLLPGIHGQWNIPAQVAFDKWLLQEVKGAKKGVMAIEDKQYEEESAPSVAAPSVAAPSVAASSPAKAEAKEQYEEESAPSVAAPSVAAPSVAASSPAKAEAKEQYEEESAPSVAAPSVAASPPAKAEDSSSSSSSSSSSGTRKRRRVLQGVLNNLDELQEIHSVDCCPHCNTLLAESKRAVKSLM